jgi:hypothetical protein
MIRRLRLASALSSAAVLSIALVVFLSGCGTALAATARVARSAYGPLLAGAAPVKGIAALRAQPNGLATLTWDPTADNTLTVDLAPSGLSPANPGAYHSDPYPAELGTGSCQQPGGGVHQLEAVTADKYGAGASTTTIKGIAGGIPGDGWHLALSAPAVGGKPGLVLACANVINPKPSTTEKQTVKTWLHGMPSGHGGEGAYGAAHLMLDGTTLTVKVFLGGLAPGSKHDAHIHSGSCEKQGPVVHNLETVVADADGRAEVETTIKGVESIPGNWYINIHNSTDLNTQAGFQPISCGNVFTRS